MCSKRYLDMKVIKRQARELRKNSTKAESLLWKYLRNRNLSGYKFLRQHPIIYKADYKGLNYFIADFYCHEKRIIVELDGPVHLSTIEYDKFRDDELAYKGIKVLRIRNEELENIEGVLSRILQYVESQHKT